MQYSETRRQVTLSQQSSLLQRSHGISSPLPSAEAQAPRYEEELGLLSPVRLTHRSFDRWQGAAKPPVAAKSDDSPWKAPRLYLHHGRWESEVQVSSRKGADTVLSPRLPTRPLKKRNTRKITSV